MDEIKANQTGSLDGYTVVFDLDGTLIDTAPDLVAAMNYSLSKSGYSPVAPALVQGQIGLGSMAMLRVGLASQNIELVEAEMKEMRSVFLDYYARNIAAQSAPYPGVIDALDRLEGAGARIAICTNKPQKLADALLNALKVRKRFRAVIGSDSVPQPKPHPDHLLHTIELAGGNRQRAIMIGDSSPDEKAAQTAGLPFIFVPFGYGPIAPTRNVRIEVANYTQLTPKVILGLF